MKKSKEQEFFDLVENLAETPKEHIKEYVQNLSLIEVEEIIEEISTHRYYYETNYENSDFLIKHCFCRRKTLLNELFVCTPENLKHIENAFKFFQREKEISLQKGKNLYEQTKTLFEKEKSEKFSDFYIKLSMTIGASDNHLDSILHLPNDGSGSNYHKMAECLSKYYFNNRDFQGSFVYANHLFSNHVDFYGQRDIKSLKPKDLKEKYWEDHTYDFGNKFPE